jgi:hypothetical protein
MRYNHAYLITVCLVLTVAGISCNQSPNDANDDLAIPEGLISASVQGNAREKLLMPTGQR